MRFLLALVTALAISVVIGNKPAAAEWSATSGLGEFFIEREDAEGVWGAECTLEGPNLMLEYFEAGANSYKRELRLHLDYVDDSEDVRVYVDDRLQAVFRKVGIEETGILGVLQFDPKFVKSLASGRLMIITNGDRARTVSLIGSARAARTFLLCANSVRTR